MTKLDIQMCPETGICSIMNEKGKIDIISAEVDELRDAENPQKLKELLSQVDSSFAESLTDGELEQLANGIK